MFKWNSLDAVCRETPPYLGKFKIGGKYVFFFLKLLELYM